MCHGMLWATICHEMMGATVSIVHSVLLMLPFQTWKGVCFFKMGILCRGCVATKWARPKNVSYHYLSLSVSFKGGSKLEVGTAK